MLGGRLSIVYQEILFKQKGWFAPVMLKIHIYMNIYEYIYI